MLGLPKTAEISKALPKKAIFEHFNPSPSDRKLFDEQIKRLSIVAEISPHTVAVKAGASVAAVYVILVTLKVATCDPKNIALLSKLIDQRMLFVLQFGDSARLAVYRAGKVLMSESKPLSEWELSLNGLDLDAVWDNIIAEIAGFNITSDKDLDSIIIENDRREKLLRKITVLEKKARTETQPRKKWDLVNEIKKLKKELEELSNG